MSEGNKEAFCLLLWRSTGGAIDGKGRPTHRPQQIQLPITDDDIELEEEKTIQHGTANPFARGLCTRPYDCTDCVLMQDELRHYPPEEVNWVCSQCLKDISVWAKQTGAKVDFPGFYSEGACSYRGCTRPSRIEDSEGFPGMSGGQQVETGPGYSRFLQLVIGRIH